MLENCEPKQVWAHFEKFCGIPHPSGHEKRAAKYIVDLAARLGLAAITDKTGNVLVRKETTDPSPGRKGVILQSHLDMVPQKNADTAHDFLADPIRPWIDGEWVKAGGTTLGADNGIGVAIACAVLESGTISHGPVEALFTVDEERGMTGAFNLSDNFLSGTRLINLDTENENELCIGCAGGTDIIGSFSAVPEPVPEGHKAFTISMQGLFGGHSGMEIHLGRGNALKLVARLFEKIEADTGLRIASVKGGSACNAIPREVFVTVTVPEKHETAFIEGIAAFGTTVSRELSSTDPDFRCTATPTRLPTGVFPRSTQRQFLAVLLKMPHGVLSMSTEMKGTVETSNNPAIISTGKDSVRIECMARSSSSAALDSLRGEITALMKSNGAAVSYDSIFPGWQPDPSSTLLTTLKKVYTGLNGREPEIVAVHAGLECGVIGARYPRLEMVSCGPTIHFAHSPDERLHIGSVERFWKFLVAGLEEL